MGHLRKRVGADAGAYCQTPVSTMTVYVDHAFAAGDWGRWTGGGHLQADSREELESFARRLGLRAEWLQRTPGRPEKDHYDLDARRRELALRLGAVAEDGRDGARRRRDLRDARRRLVA